MVETADTAQPTAQPQPFAAVPKHLLPFTFGVDPDYTRTLSQRGVEARKNRQPQGGDTATAIATSQPHRDAVQTAIAYQLNLVKEQIIRTRAILNDDRAEWCEHCERGGMAAHHRAQLLKAMDGLLDRQRKLLGIPDPGPRRSPPADDRRVTPAAAWIDEAGTIDLQPESPAGPVAPTDQPADTPTGSVPTANQLPETPTA